ncbi:hypothetical protein EDB86DRAFT_1286410 [Lactarius hatsudake]|nr:hypothetical protein EDB86DRAFT_1286410 [Lactarius hatsudake]
MVRQIPIPRPINQRCQPILFLPTSHSLTVAMMSRDALRPGRFGHRRSALSSYATHQHRSNGLAARTNDRAGDPTFTPAVLGRSTSAPGPVPVGTACEGDSFALEPCPSIVWGRTTPAPAVWAQNDPRGWFHAAGGHLRALNAGYRGQRRARKKPR